MSYLSIWKKHAILREGKRLDVYKDSLGKLTVGIGHLVTPKDNLKKGDVITEAECQAFFEKDTKAAERAALTQAKEMNVTHDFFIAALISVNFQLGKAWKNKFKTTYPALVSGDYDTAIKNLRGSLWYKQTPVRVEDFIKAIEKLKAMKERPLAKTKTMAGASVAGVGLVASEAVTEVTTQIEPLVPYADSLRLVFVVLALLGVGLTVYARVSDRKKGYR